MATTQTVRAVLWLLACCCCACGSSSDGEGVASAPAPTKVRGAGEPATGPKAAPAPATVTDAAAVAVAPPHDALAPAPAATPEAIVAAKRAKCEKDDRNARDCAKSGISSLAKLTLQPQAIRQLDLSHNQISDIARLAEMKGLEKLNLTGNPVRDLSPLAKLSLRSLNASDTRVANLRALRKMTSLETLSLAGTQVSDASLRSIARLPGLTELDLSRTKVANIRVLAKAHGLLTLSLRDTKVASVTTLMSLPYLTKLDLRGTPMSQKNIRMLSDKRGLVVQSTLPPGWVSACKMNLKPTTVRVVCDKDDDLTALAKLPNLAELDVEVGGNGAGLQKLTQLKKLRLTVERNTTFSLQGMTNLEHLTVYGATDAVASIATLRKLKYLRLSGAELTTVAPLAKLTLLRYLDIRGSRVKSIAPLAALTQLRSLNLASAPIDDATPLAAMTNLRWLNIAKASANVLPSVVKLASLRMLALGDRRNAPGGDTALVSLGGLAHLDALYVLAKKSQLKSLRKAKPQLTIFGDISPIPYAAHAPSAATKSAPADFDCFDTASGRPVGSYDARPGLLPRPFNWSGDLACYIDIDPGCVGTATARLTHNGRSRGSVTRPTDASSVTRLLFVTPAKVWQKHPRAHLRADVRVRCGEQNRRYRSSIKAHFMWGE